MGGQLDDEVDGRCCASQRISGIEVLRSGEDVEAEHVDVGAESSREQGRDEFGVDAELLRTAAHPHSRALDAKVRVDPHGDTSGRTPSRSPAATTRCASVGRLQLDGDPGGDGVVDLLAVLPGPAKLTWSGGIVVSSAVIISPADATSNESTSPPRCCTTAGIGLAFTA